MEARQQTVQRGWDEPNDEPLKGLGAIVLVLSSGFYFATVWLLMGLAPLPTIASALSWLRGRRTTQSTHYSKRGGQ